jgi:hypothetical protein
MQNVLLHVASMFHKFPSTLKLLEVGVNLGAKVAMLHVMLRFVLGTFMSHAFSCWIDIYMAPEAKDLEEAEV